MDVRFPLDDCRHLVGDMIVVGLGVDPALRAGIVRILFGERRKISALAYFGQHLFGLLAGFVFAQRFGLRRTRLGRTWTWRRRLRADENVTRVILFKISLMLIVIGRDFIVADQFVGILLEVVQVRVA